ncbi:RidA family protein [Pantoea sp. NPDC088449]|uniref:2-iminobutanoate/2-iminopropanoate deaminase n=1 Tax=Candidatus Pantoea floridensis TaxID=1938870 RepID=A0A286DM68_9GAMM|nr:Rid family hydrolase [Pantoea floridensis]PIF14780.1 2-iminobutanoate/2-iminopropanoate deaminase [Enterobacteriaceae bacterium JKS000233]SOD59594.1 2-iminobutanoate/2-iminopropanoate deaminase [Pantoea floridensis]
MITRKNYPQLGEVKAPYVHAVKHADTLYVSGLTAFGTPAQQADIAAQAEAIFQQLHCIAGEEQSSLENLIKVTIFITSFDEINTLRSVLFRHYGDHLPASSLVQISQLFSPELKIEIEAIIAL